MDPYVGWGLAGMGLSLVLLPVSAFFFARERLGKYREKKEYVADYRLAVVEDSLHEALIAVSRRVNYRHNIHCPLCGRFSKSVEGLPPSVSDCVIHGVQMRTTTATIPIQIAAVTGDFPVLEAFEIPELVDGARV